MLVTLTEIFVSLAVLLWPYLLGDLVVGCMTRNREAAQWTTIILLFDKTTKEKRIGNLVCYCLTVNSATVWVVPVFFSQAFCKTSNKRWS